MSESNGPSFSDKLDTDIWRTKGARFNAYRRLSDKQLLVTIVTSFSSIHLIAISILQISNVIPISDIGHNLLSFISIIVSIAILVYGLIEGGKNYGLKAEKLHACGLELDTLYKKLRVFIDKDDTEEIYSIAIEYPELLSKFNLNHEPIDDRYFRISDPGVFYKGGLPSLEPYKTTFSYIWASRLLASLTIFIPFLLSACVIFKFNQFCG